MSPSSFSARCCLFEQCAARRLVSRPPAESAPRARRSAPRKGAQWSRLDYLLRQRACPAEGLARSNGNPVHALSARRPCRPAATRRPDPLIFRRQYGCRHWKSDKRPLSGEISTAAGRRMAAIVFREFRRPSLNSIRERANAAGWARGCEPRIVDKDRGRPTGTGRSETAGNILHLCPDVPHSRTRRTKALK